MAGTTVVVVAAALMAGCVVDGPSKPEPPKPKPAPRETALAVKLIVSPLTRIGFDAQGTSCIFMHIDYRDATDRSIKAYGRLHFELFRPGDTPDKQALAQSWDADLRDPVQNALRFDEMITHTYVINLGGIPEWLLHWARHEGDAKDAAAPTVVVQYFNGDSTDSSRALKAVYALTR
jgi:hypothetical protein